jgi:hypothetical protein
MQKSEAANVSDGVKRDVRCTTALTLKGKFISDPRYVAEVANTRQHRSFGFDNCVFAAQQGVLQHNHG